MKAIKITTLALIILTTAAFSAAIKTPTFTQAALAGVLLMFFVLNVAVGLEPVGQEEAQ
jgi:hypothetical protein